MSEERTVKSADRTLDLLELLAASGRAMSHSEIARRTQVPKASLTGLLRNLVQRGYVELAPDSSLYQLGEATYSLGRRGASSRELVRAAEPWLKRVVEATGESAGISVLRNDIAERVAAAQSSTAILYSLHVGVLQPLYASSAGKILLSWMPAAQREKYLCTVKLIPRTARTVRSVSVLRRQLRDIRTEGVAWSLGEFTAGIVGVAVPVLDVHGRAIAALGVALPESRLDDATIKILLRAIKSASREISRRLTPDFNSI